LVSCPIALCTVTRIGGKRHFHFISPKAGHRVRMVALDSATGEEVAHRDLVTGFKIANDRYGLLDVEDFKQARIETSSTM